MKKRTLSLAVLATLSAPAAFAQSNVTLYGLISEGYVYTNNVGGKSMSELKGKLQQGSRWGMRGTADWASSMARPTVPAHRATTAASVSAPPGRKALGR